MSEIKTFKFNKDNFDNIRDYKYGSNWPVVYLLQNKKEMYIGETVNAFGRSKQHYENEDRARLTTIHIVSDEEYNKSAALDIESWLIQYISAEGSFKLQNGNRGLRNSNYYDREKYKSKFEVIWKKLREMSIVKKDLVRIKNTDLFKYSPYKSLTDEQISVVIDIFRNIKSIPEQIHIVNGRPGTGKTILAVYLMKYLTEHKDTKHLNIAMVVPMTSLRKTIRKVFKNTEGLNSKMVLGPSDVIKEKYDVLLIDEAHRLKQRRNITNYFSFDNTNKALNLDKTGTELDWILKSSRHQIFFYDEKQSIRPSDIHPSVFDNLSAQHYELTSQMRVEAGSQYINFIEDLFDMNIRKEYSFENYNFKIYDHIHAMVDDIKKRDSEAGLSRMVAGYAWPWYTAKGIQEFDIEIDGLKLVWNRTNQDWVNSKGAIDEVGCIHTVQGYDLNYVGVIIGPELSYNPQTNKLVINPDEYYDANGKRSITDPEELERYIINIYKTLMTRGIKGTYLYICDIHLREYFKKHIK